MNQRIAFAAMAILLTAHVLTGTMSREAAALVGTYVASASAGGEAYVLTLGSDASASLVTRTEGGAAAAGEETGAWILEGSSVQVAFKGDPATGSATALTFEIRDGALVAASGDDSVARFAGLTFVRSDVQPTSARDN